MESPKSLQPNILFPELLMLREGSEDCLYINVYTKNVQMEGELSIEKVFKIHFKDIFKFVFSLSGSLWSSSFLAAPL